MSRRRRTLVSAAVLVVLNIVGLAALRMLTARQPHHITAAAVRAIQVGMTVKDVEQLTGLR